MPICCSTCCADCGDDKLIPHIVWQNLHPLLDEQSERVRRARRQDRAADEPEPGARSCRASIERILGAQATPIRSRRRPALELLSSGRRTRRSPSARQMPGACWPPRCRPARSPASGSTTSRRELEPLLDDRSRQAATTPAVLDAALLATTWKDPRGSTAARHAFASTAQPDDAAAAGARRSGRRGRRRTCSMPSASVLADRRRTARLEFRGQVLDALGRLDDPQVADVVLDALSADSEPDAAAAGDRAADRARRLEQAAAGGDRRQEDRPPTP